MPSPKVGTVTFEVGETVKAVKAGRVEYKVDKAGIVHAPIGKVSFGSDKIRENFIALLQALSRAKPSTSKGIYFRSLSLSPTMGPGVIIDSGVTRAI
jgi:large subunit ribosomal protein L1